MFCSYQCGLSVQWCWVRSALKRTSRPTLSAAGSCAARLKTWQRRRSSISSTWCTWLRTFPIHIEKCGTHRKRTPLAFCSRTYSLRSPPSTRIRIGDELRCRLRLGTGRATWTPMWSKTLTKRRSRCGARAKDASWVGDRWLYWRRTWTRLFCLQFDCTTIENIRSAMIDLSSVFRQVDTVPRKPALKLPLKRTKVSSINGYVLKPQNAYNLCHKFNFAGRRWPIHSLSLTFPLYAHIY